MYAILYNILYIIYTCICVYSQYLKTKLKMAQHKHRGDSREAGRIDKVGW